MSEIQIGFEKGEGASVFIPLIHTFLSGITRHGKSETARKMIEQAAKEGYTVVVFDVKRPRDYADIGVEIPIYLEEATDPTVLKGLLEKSSGTSLNWQYAELIKVVEPGDTYQDILDRMDRIMADDETHPIEEDRLLVLHHLLQKLVTEFQSVTISESLELQEGAVNVMDLHEVAEEVQQLTINSTVSAILEGHEDVIIVIDEAHNFIPQRASPPAKATISKAIREGAAMNVWVFLADQTITGVDKDPLKQVGVWLLGRQREKNEAEHVLDQIPTKTGYSTDDVMTLEKGHFICAVDDQHPIVYIQPTWLGDESAKAIATGEVHMEDITETETEDVQDIEVQLEERESRIRELEQELVDRDDRIAELHDEIDELNNLLEGDFQPSPPEATETTSVDEDAVRRILEEYITDADFPDSIHVRQDITRIEVFRSSEPLHVTDSDLLGKVAILYADGDIPSDKWVHTGDLHDLIQSRGWADDPRGTEVMDNLCQWGYFEKKYAGNRPMYRMKLSPEEARDRGLLKEHEAEHPA